jgi:hypothetical protein
MQHRHDTDRREADKKAASKCSPPPTSISHITTRLFTAEAFFSFFFASPQIPALLPSAVSQELMR